MNYIFFGEKEVVCDETNVKEVVKKLFSLGYTIINRGKLADDTWAFEVCHQ